MKMQFKTTDEKECSTYFDFSPPDFIDLFYEPNSAYRFQLFSKLHVYTTLKLIK